MKSFSYAWIEVTLRVPDFTIALAVCVDKLIDQTMRLWAEYCFEGNV